MAKYKVGDKVRIVSERPASPSFVNSMVQYLGKTLTVSKVEEETLGAIYRFKEATYPADLTPFVSVFFPNANGMFPFYEDWIAGLAEPKKPEFSVSVHFHDRLTVAELIKDGKVVKAENARCNPKDKYSMAEGTRIAVERLFRKKPSSSNNASKVRSVDDIASGIATGVRGAIEPKIGDKFVVIKRGCSGHHFNLGDVVTLVELRLDGAFEFVDKTGLLQTLYCDEVTYWRNASNEQTESNP